MPGRGRTPATPITPSVVDVGSRPAVGADLVQSSNSYGVELSLALPTLVVWIRLEASCSVADCGRGSTWRGGETAMVMVGGSPGLQASPGQPRQSPALQHLGEGEDGTDRSVSMW